MPQAHKAADLLDALERHMARRNTAMLREVTMTDPGVLAQRRAFYANENQLAPTDEGWLDSTGIRTPVYRRIDALLIAPPSKGHLRTAVEVKVTRADFLRETDDKRRAWRDHTHRFVYLAPVGLLRPEEMPEGCGLWEVAQMDGYSDRSYYLPPVVTRRARTNAEPLQLWDEPFSAYMAGRASRAEQGLADARRRTAIAEAEVVRLRGEVAATRDQVWDQVPR